MNRVQSPQSAELSSASAAADVQEILEGIAPLLRDVFASDAWGRLLVFIEPTETGWAVSDLEVEELDAALETRVETSFYSDAARANLPVLAAATQALVLLADADLEFLRGGTFVRDESGFRFLPGRVKAPSPGFAERRHSLVQSLETASQQLASTHCIEDVANSRGLGQVALRRRDDPSIADTFQVLLVGSYANARRSWVWGAHNPSVDPATKMTIQRRLDAFSDRSLWEISTPGFTTDTGTAWALVGLALEAGWFSWCVKLQDADGWLALGLTAAS